MAQDIIDGLASSNGDGDDFIQWIKIKGGETIFDSGWTEEDEEEFLGSFDNDDF